MFFVKKFEKKVATYPRVYTVTDVNHCASTLLQGATIVSLQQAKYFAHFTDIIEHSCRNKIYFNSGASRRSYG